MRVIALIDIDSFYVQVERLLNPDLKDKPCAVVQYNPWKGGGIIALSYEAKSKGVCRGMRGEDAKELCPDINLVTVPENRGKADLSKYREESVKIVKILNEFCASMERASIDEAYLDITENINKRINENVNLNIKLKSLKNNKIGLLDVLSHEDIDLLQRDTCIAPNKLVSSLAELESWFTTLNDDEIPDFIYLVFGAIITKHIRDAILTQCGYECSAGIAPNKILAKLACGINKPNKQTIIKPDSVQSVYSNVPISKITGLGGKFGASLRDKYEIEYMSELAKIPLSKLKKDFGDKSATWLYDLGRGIENEPIRNRTIAKSIGCSKNFPGKMALVNFEKIGHWFLQLILEMLERLAKDRTENNRCPQTLHVGLTQNVDGTPTHVSHQFPFPTNFKTAQRFCQICIDSVKKFNRGRSQDRWDPPITNISLSATNFAPSTKGSTDLRSFIKRQTDEREPVPGSSSPTTPPKKTASQKSPPKLGEASGETQEYDDYMPGSSGEMDREVFDGLPPDIKMEIKGHLLNRGKGSHRIKAGLGGQKKVGGEKKTALPNKKRKKSVVKNEATTSTGKRKRGKITTPSTSNILDYLK